jgi:hypothetical protein
MPVIRSGQVIKAPAVKPTVVPKTNQKIAEIKKLRLALNGSSLYTAFQIFVSACMEGLFLLDSILLLE